MALNACEKGERLCIKAVGQERMQDGRRKRCWGLNPTELDREWFYVLLKLSMGWNVGEGNGLELHAWKMSLKIKVRDRTKK